MIQDLSEAVEKAGGVGGREVGASPLAVAAGR